jgi:hypothetical protein
MAETVEEILVSYFKGESIFLNFGIQKMRQEYLWKGADYEQTVREKFRLSAAWQELEQMPEADRDAGRDALAVRIVKEWGGIGSNGPGKLAKYCAEVGLAETDIPFTGIASRSKILPIAHPDRFVIMDARVVIALAAVQLLASPKKGVLFPYMASRNRILTRSNPAGFLAKPQFRRKEILKQNPDWRKVDRSVAYAEYLLLLRAVSKALDGEGLEHKIWDLEMTLFSQVIGLVTLLDRPPLPSTSAVG